MTIKIKEIGDLYNFLVSNEKSLPGLDAKNEDVKAFYDKAKCMLIRGNKRSLVQKKLSAMDNLLAKLIYAKESLIMNGKNPEMVNNYSQLIEKFIDYPELIANNNNIKLSQLSDGVNRLVLLVTHACQLRCKYCSVRKFNAEMDETTLKRAINLLFTSNKNEVELQFFGGEPLLRFDLVKKGVDYAEKLAKQSGKKIKFLLTTNGIALTDEKIDYFIKHNFTIEFSLDGDIETQLKFRRCASGTDYYDIVMENLMNLARKKADYYIISVVSPSNVPDLFKNFKYLLDKGFMRLQINYALGNFWGEKESEILFEQLSKVIQAAKKAPNNPVVINSLKNRREPVVLNAEITVDCDSTIYLETGICLEEDFNRLKQDFKLGDLDTIRDINTIFTTRSRNLKKLVDVYSKDRKEFRKITLNNIEIGMKLNKLFKNAIK